MKDKKGFTLVELLAVVVIMGIIIGISIPAVTAVQKRLVKQRVTTFYRIVDESVDAYVEQYHTDFEKTRDCFEISYKDLIDQELLKETDITCLSEAYTGVEGKIIATRVNGGETFTYTHYLTCYDKETEKPLSKSESLPEGCIGIRGGFSLDVKAIHVKRGGGEEPYECTNPDNSCWVSGSIRYEFSSVSPYYYPVKEFQYRKLGDIKWESIPSTGSGTGNKVFATSNNTNYEESSTNMDVKFRTVDTGNNISSENGVHYIRVDNTIPTANIVGAPEGWQRENTTVNFTSNVVPSGIKKYIVELNNGTARTVEVEGNVAQYTFSDNFNGTIRVKAESNTGIVGDWSATKEIKLDKISPTCTVSTTNANWTKNNVTITGTCSDEGGSLCKPNVTRTFSTNTNSNESPGSVCDGANNCTPCGTIAVKVDKTQPTVSEISINNRTNSSNPGVSATCSDTFGELTSTTASISCSKSGNNSTCTATCTDKGGNSNSRNQSYTWSAVSNPCGTYNTNYHDCMTCPHTYCSSYTCSVTTTCSRTCYTGSCMCSDYVQTSVDSCAYTNCGEYCANARGLGMIGGSLRGYTDYYSCSKGGQCCSATSNSCGADTCWDTYPNTCWH